MNICACRECKKMFKSFIKQEYCNDCLKDHGDQFDDIIAYLKEFPNSNAMQISEALDIPVRVIINYIDQGRLHMIKGTFNKIPNKF